jgi:hypothetical protein
LTSYPGTRSEIELGELPFSILHTGWVEFALDASALSALVSNVVGDAAWDGRVGFVVATTAAVDGTFEIHSSRIPFLRATYNADTAPDPVVVALPRRPFGYPRPPRPVLEGVEGGMEEEQRLQPFPRKRADGILG